MGGCAWKRLTPGGPGKSTQGPDREITPGQGSAEAESNPGLQTQRP